MSGQIRYDGTGLTTFPEGPGPGETLESSAQSDTTQAFDPGEHTIPEVEEYIEKHPDEAEAVLAAEKAGKNRVTLVPEVEQVVEEQSDADTSTDTDSSETAESGSTLSTDETTAGSRAGDSQTEET